MRICKQQGRSRRPFHLAAGFTAALFLAFGESNSAAASGAAPLSLPPASFLTLHVGGLFGSSSSEDEPSAPAAVDITPAAAPRPEQVVINPLDALSPFLPGPGEWRQVPSLQFDRFGLTDQEANALNIRGTDGSAAVLGRQTGSAYDPEGFLWYFWGGGGSSYGGNEVYRLDLTLPLMSQITQPSVLDTTVTVPNANNCFAPSDGPAAGSTFDGFVWSPATQSFFVFPSGGFCPSGVYNQETIWEFDPLAGTWDSVVGMAGLDGPVFAEYDPASGLIYIVEAGVNATLRHFDPVTGQLGARNSLGTKLTVGNAVLDTGTDKMIVFAQEGVYAISLTNLGSIGRLADVPNDFDPASGAALDQQRGIVALWAGGKTVRSFNLATNLWTKEIASSGPTAGPGGVFSKWIAIKELGILAGYHNPAEGFWLYRLPATLSAPAPGNSAPVAVVDFNQISVHAGSLVNLGGTGSFDVDGDTLSYAWTTVSSPGGNAPTLATPDQATSSFTPAVNGGYVVRLTVSDGVLSDTGTVTVTAGNAVPVADAGANQSILAGQTATLSGSGSSDADGDTLSYAWTLTAVPAGSAASLTGSTTASPSFVTDIVGTYRLSMTVDDGLASATDTMDVTASAVPVNRAPVADAGPDQTKTEGQAASLTGLQSSDPDGDTLSYAWTLMQKPSGSAASLSSATAAQPTLTLDVAGTYVARLVVNDGTLSSSADDVTLTANIDLGTAGGGAGPVAYWTFDEGSGSTVSDSIGTSNGTVIGAEFDDGVSGKALNFDGVNDYVVFANTQALDITGNRISMSAWIYPRSGGGSNGARIISKANDNRNADVYSMLTEQSRIAFRLDSSGGGTEQMDATQLFTNDQWIHVAVVYDGVDKRIYVNGVLDQATPQAKTDIVDASSMPVHLGRREGSSDRFFDGAIDEVRIYDRTLTANEILAQFLAYTVPSTGPGPIAQGGGSSGGGSTGGGTTPPVTGGGPGNLSQVAAQMSVGEFRLLNTTGYNASLYDACNGTRIVLEWANRGYWDTLRNVFHFVGQGHFACEKHLVYAETTNSWSTATNPDFGGIGHGYEHNAMDPATGNLFYRRYNKTEIRKYNPTSGTWANIPGVPASARQVAGAIEYFPEMQGLIFVDSSAGVWLFREPSNSWTQLAGGAVDGLSGAITANIGPYHNFATYHPGQNMVLFGGGNGSNAIYKIDAQGTVSQVASSPDVLGINFGMVLPNLVTGNFMAFYNNGQIYEYRVASNSWVYIGNHPIMDNATQWRVGAIIENRGVFMFITDESKVLLYKYGASPQADTQAPVFNSTLNLTGTTDRSVSFSWPAATDNVGVAGYRIYRDGGSIATTQSANYTASGLTASTAYNFSVEAYDVAGNNSARTQQLAVTTSAPTGGSSGGSADFAALCADSNVIFCQDFNTLPGYGTDLTEGIFVNGETNSCDNLSWPRNCPQIDNGAMMFTVPTNSGSSASGQYYVNFAQIAGSSIGKGDSVFVRWKQKFSDSFLTTHFTDGGGFKQMILGDPTDYSCSNNELVVQDLFQRGFAQMYHACGIFTPLTVNRGGASIDLQPVGDGPGTCWYAIYPAHPDCFRYFPDEWMRFQVGLDYAPSGKSRVRLWAALENDPDWTLIIDIDWQLVDTANGYGKVWLLPYHTGKSSGQAHPEGYIWYDELIVSRSFVAD